MTDRSPWVVALATANLVFLAAAAFLVRGRLAAIEEKLPVASAPERPSRGRDGPKGGADPIRSGPNGEALAALEAKLQKLSDDSYDMSSDMMNDLHEMKRTLKQVSAAVRRLSQGIASPGSPSGVWGLLPLDKPLTPEALSAYRKDAEAWGVKASPGRVEVRGVLNMSPWATMPIEYFVTRWPDSGHETLMHVLGPAPLDATLTPDKLRGLVTAIYKGLLVAGFTQGAGSSYLPPADPKGEPKWVPPEGDPVYVGVRYELHGQVHVARATDWVVDPSIRGVLPEDAFRFTGSRRMEDMESGDEQLSAEAGGIVVSVYRDPNTLVEIALPSNVENRYQYNYVRIPKPAVLLLANGKGKVDAVRDRAKNALRLVALERDGSRGPLAPTPALVVTGADGDTVDVPFVKAGDAWEVSHEALAKGDWRVKVILDGEPVVTTGFEPLYLDLILSKTKIVPEGDGALPVEPVAVPGDAPEAPRKPQ